MPAEAGWPATTYASKALAIAQNLAEREQFAEALDALTPALTSPDTAYDALCLAARCWLARPAPGTPVAARRLRLAAARQAAGSALALRPDGEWAHRLLAMVFLADDRPAAALRHAEEAARLSPHDATALCTLSACQLRTFRRHDARRTAEAAVTANPEDPVAYLAVARAARSLARRDEAEHAYRLGLSHDPYSEDLLLGLAETLCEQRRYVEGAEAYLAVARSNPRGEAPAKGLSQILRHLQSVVSTWRKYEPDTIDWEALGRNCPAPVDQACREFWEVADVARGQIRQALNRAQDIIVAAARSAGASISATPGTPGTAGLAGLAPGRLGTASPGNYRNRNWGVLGFDEAPVRGEPELVNARARMLQLAGEHTAELSAQFAVVAAASAGLRVAAGSGGDFREIVAGVHDGAARLAVAYQACAAALLAYGEALTQAQRETVGAWDWAERAFRRQQFSLGGLTLEQASAMVGRMLESRDADQIQAAGPLLAAVVQEDARAEERRGEQTSAADIQARRHEEQREWEEERLAARKTAELAVGTLREAEARCAQAVRSAIAGPPGDSPARKS